MTKKHHLKKDLGLLDVFCIASGAMISSGLFILPALAYAKTGPAVIFSYMLAGLLVFPAMLAKAELATAMPKAGGTYFFIERSMGAPLGTVGGFASWFSLSFKGAFALVGIGVFATLFAPGITEMQIKLIAVGCCLFFMLVNLIGAKHAGRFQVVLVLLLIGILSFYVLRGFLLIQPDRYTPVMPFGLKSVFATAGLVFISFGGLTKVAAIAEETKDPGRNVPLGMFLAFIVVMLLYVTVVFITVGVLEPQEFSNSLTPISLGAGAFMGRAGSIALAFAALLAFVSTANAGILTASRTSMALSRDSILPGFFHKMSTKTKTPYISIILTSLFMISVILFLSLETLVKTASTLMILLFLFVNLALIIMRESKIHSYRPKFYAPFYPWLQIVGIVGYGFLIFEMGRIPLAITGIFIACAFTWYLVYVRQKVNRQAALLHVIERITDKKLIDATLPDELREIIIEREKIVADRFDDLVTQAKVLDLEEAMTMEEFFRKIAKTLSEKMGVPSEALYERMTEREKQSSTVLRPGLAIPHVVIDGKQKFDILLVRCKEGIIFPGTEEPVKIVFILLGSMDERNFHLRSLAAIAEIVQQSGFDKRWLKARNEDELRDIILLAKRKREIQNPRK